MSTPVVRTTLMKFCLKFFFIGFTIAALFSIPLPLPDSPVLGLLYSCAELVLFPVSFFGQLFYSPSGVTPAFIFTIIVIFCFTNGITCMILGALTWLYRYKKKSLLNSMCISTDFSAISIGMVLPHGLENGLYSHRQTVVDSPLAHIPLA